MMLMSILINYSVQRGSSPPHLIIPFIVRSNLIMKLLEMVVDYLLLTGGHVIPHHQEKLHALERLLNSILSRRFASSVPSQSGGSQHNLPALPLTITPQGSHLSKRNADESSGEQRPNKMIKKEATGYIFSELRHETPGESSRKNDHDDDDANAAGLNLSLRL